MEEASGGRVRYMSTGSAASRRTCRAGWTGRVRAAVAAIRRRLPEASLIVGNEILEGPHPRGRRPRPRRDSSNMA